MDLPPGLADRLARLAPDQRRAATAPPGPILCVAPAGSGKTTTLVARVAWLVATGVPPAEIAAITFNRRAAEELRTRLADALGELADAPGALSGGGASAATDPEGGNADATTFGVRVRTFHALGLEILRSTGRPLGRLVARDGVLRAVAPGADQARLARLDTAISRLKLDLDVDPAAVERDPDAGPIARTYVAYQHALARANEIDFDDLVRLALHELQSDAALLAAWRRRCSHLLVDETQDVDRSQLRLALLLAAPANRIFLVGDDDQSIYGWRLADVRRVLGLAAELPGLERIDLEVNYRCPGPVLRRAVRLVEHNQERFAKAIRPGPSSAGFLVLAPDGGDDVERARRIFRSWLGVEGTFAILARTNRELLPAAAVALDLGVPFRAAGLRLLLEAEALEDVLEAVESAPGGMHLLVRIEAARAALAAQAPGARKAPAPSDDVEPPGPEPVPPEIASALLGWAVPYPDLASLRSAVAVARARIAELRRDDAALTLATAHATKGLEFDHVAVIGMDAGRFPSARALAESDDPVRVLEEERRLAYVAWTRARRSLTLVYDPAAPSSFLLEAFDGDELTLVAGDDRDDRHDRDR